MAVLRVSSALVDNSWKGTVGTSMCRSMQSTSGPLVRAM
jgi:hypothetical protein